MGIVKCVLVWLRRANCTPHFVFVLWFSRVLLSIMTFFTNLYFMGNVVWFVVLMCLRCKCTAFCLILVCIYCIKFVLCCVFNVLCFSWLVFYGESSMGFVF